VLNGRGQVIGVNNTGYVGGRACRDTVCEIRRDGTRRVYPHRDYGQQTWWLVTCLDADRRIDPAVEGCRLPKPAA
jgi:hypothetical protein